MAFEISISGCITSEEYNLFGDSGFSLNSLDKLLAEMPSDETEIHILINSGGGLVSEGFAIYDRLMSLPQTVNTTVLGMCGSIATVIAQVGKKGVRKMYENSEYFVHMPYWTPSAPDGFESSDLIKIAEELTKSEQRILSLYVDATGGNEDALRTKMKEATSLSSAEAKEFGFVDEVISTKIINQVRYNIAAYTDTQIKHKLSNMDAKEIKDEIKKSNGIIENFMNEIKALLKPKIKNEMATTADGKEVHYTGALEVGTKLFWDAEMTMPCEDGDYLLNGNLYTVMDGAVIEVKEEYVDAKDAKIAELTQALADKEAALNEVNTNLELTNANVEKAVATAEAVATEFTNFKNKITTGGGLTVTPAQPKKGSDAPEEDWKAKLLAERAKNKKK